MVFKCKMCGGDLTPKEGSNIGVCSYCKSTMTLPNLENEKIVNLYNRANDLRLSNRFDESKEIYEKILLINNNEIEAHWGILLCKYGIEYVDDPKTKKKIPTCHRTIDTSILIDPDFKFIKKEAYGEALELYVEEAKAIDKIQTNILNISKKEKPYDIFICYKETDENGERTEDSVMAEDIYKELIKQEYKVFFSKITLESKLGEAYEPYIYSALKSAKVMLVVGTKEEYFNAVWVKNEWSRFLNMAKKNVKKTIIPIYKDMNIGNLPEEFSIFQAINADSIGFMQDLMRGINKITKKKNSNQGNSVSNIISDTLAKVYDYLDRGEYITALKYLEILDAYDEKNPEVLICHLMIEMKIRQEEDFKSCDVILSNNYYYGLILKYADKETIERIEEYNKYSIYNYACKISQYKLNLFLVNSRRYFESIIDFKDSKERIKIIDQKLVKNKKRQKQFIVLLIILLILIIAGIVGQKYYKNVISPQNEITRLGILIKNNEYEKANNLYNKINTKYVSKVKKQEYEEVRKELVYHECMELIKTNEESNIKEAINKLETILGYKDAKNQKYEAEYSIALKKYNEKDYVNALKLFYNLSEYEKASIEFEKIKSEIYENGKKEFNASKYKSAKTWFEYLKSENYKDSNELFLECEKRIVSQRQKYNGIWLEAQGFWDNIKIDDKGIYTASNIDYKRGNWQKERFTYDEDTNKFIMEHWSGAKYLVKINGRTLNLKWLNPIDKYDTDWFGEYKRFYKK